MLMQGMCNDGIMTSDRFMMPSLMNEGPFDLTSTSGSVLNLWSKHYAYIAQANLILERLETNKEVIDENAGHSTHWIKLRSPDQLLKC